MRPTGFLRVTFENPIKVLLESPGHLKMAFNALKYASYTLKGVVTLDLRRITGLFLASILTLISESAVVGGKVISI